MKRKVGWLGVTLAGIVVSLLLLWLCLRFLSALFWGALGADIFARRNTAVADIFTRTGLNGYAARAISDDLSIGGVLTSFVQTDYRQGPMRVKPGLRKEIMETIAHLPGWRKEAISTEAYAELLTAACPDAAFLLPMDVTFDARYEAANEVALFDQDTGLMIDLRTDVQPESGTLSLLGLTIPHNGYVYRLENHGGFLGDSIRYRACVVPEAERAAFIDALGAHADWQRGTVTRDEYHRMHQFCFHGITPLYPAEGTAFDWWCWVDTYARRHPGSTAGFIHDATFMPAVMKAAGAYSNGSGWLVALYDEDTGLFVCYEEDS